MHEDEKQGAALILMLVLITTLSAAILWAYDQKDQIQANTVYIYKVENKAPDYNAVSNEKFKERIALRNP